MEEPCVVGSIPTLGTEQNSRMFIWEFFYPQSKIELMCYTILCTLNMRIEKTKAIKLRRQGHSYNEISRRLSVPKSTLSGWLGRIQLSDKAQKRIAQRVASGSLRGLLKRNRNQTHLAIERMKKTRAESSREIKKLSQHDLKLLGIALYWAEGYKRVQVINGRARTHHPVALSNSDPRLVAIYLRFLREVCEVEDKNIHAEIRMFEHMNRVSILNFWRRLTKLSVHNFSKVYYGVSKSSQGKRPFNRLPYGTIAIRVNNTHLFHTIMGWIEGAAQLDGRP